MPARPPHSASAHGNRCAGGHETTDSLHSNTHKHLIHDTASARRGRERLVRELYRSSAVQELTEIERHERGAAWLLL